MVRNRPARRADSIVTTASLQLHYSTPSFHGVPYRNLLKFTVGKRQKLLDHQQGIIYRNFPVRLVKDTLAILN